jgi:hypothetical protein
MELMNLLNKPKWGTSEEWAKWESETRANRPVAYFLFETLPTEVSYLLYRVKNAMRWVRYRTFDRYHIVHTGLKPGYYDVDTRMLHAVMHLVGEFVAECEGPEGLARWVAKVEDTEQARVHGEILEIHRWWTETVPNRDDGCLDIYSILLREQTYLEEDTKYLRRAIDLRHYMWT